MPIKPLTFPLFAFLFVVPTLTQAAPSPASPQTSPHIHLYQKLNPAWWFATSKPPVFYQPQDKLRNIHWFFRNPLHNFTFYVIGISDHANSPAYHRYGEYPTANFSPHPGWNLAMIHYHFLRLPYIAYWNPHMSFYAGWRLAGEFGLKLNFFHHPVESP